MAEKLIFEDLERKVEELDKDPIDRVFEEEGLQTANRHGAEPNEFIKREDVERKHLKLTLEKRDEELKARNYELQQTNVALEVLIKQREKYKAKLEEDILSNVKNLVEPYLEKLKKTGLDAIQKDYLNILQSNLSEIVSPFTRKLSSNCLSLTPSEIQIADLVKHGKTTKEIAELLRISCKTVGFHRENIRKKLGLKKKKANLRTHLFSFM